MNKQLNRLYKKLNKQEHEELQFLSFSIDPATDNPRTLKNFQVQETHRLGIQNFLTFAGKDSESAGGYAHSGSFTLVDAHGYVRGVYAVTNFDLTVNEQEFDRMVKEIKILYNEHTSSK